MTFWRTAYQQHGASVLAFLSSRVQRREDAEDLLQETFIRAIRAGAPLRDHGKVKSYLFTIAHRLSLDHYRERRERPFADYDDSLADIVEGIPDSAAAPDDRAAQRELLDHVARTLAALPENLRKAFELGVVQKREYLEIAALTGWSLANVKSNVFRARQRVIAGISHLLGETGVEA